MSLVEQLFPAAELAAMKHAVLAADDHQPAAKRRKVQRQNSVRSRYSSDSGYSSDDSTHASQATAPTLVGSNSRSSRPQAPDSPTGPQSDAEDFCEKIAQARARLYSNASLGCMIPSPPTSSREAAPAATAPQNVLDLPGPQEEYHSPVSVESLADTSTTSGCNLGTFISLGLAVTSHERSLLSSLTPVPRAMPTYSSEVHARKLQWLQRRRAAALMRRRQQQQQHLSQQSKRPSYAGFAISTHDDYEEFGEELDEAKDQHEHEHEHEHEQKQKQKQKQNNQLDQLNKKAETQDDAGVRPCQSSSASASASDEIWSAQALELMDHFFNIDAASEEGVPSSSSSSSSSSPQQR